MIPPIVTAHLWVDVQTMLPSEDTPVPGLCGNYGVDGEVLVKWHLMRWWTFDQDRDDWKLLEVHQEPMKWRNQS